MGITSTLGLGQFSKIKSRAMRKFQALALGLLGLAAGAPQQKNVDKDGRQLLPTLGLFSVVNFRNDECPGVVGNVATGLLGTCVSADECSSANGIKQGNCAAGFGVCCIYRTTACTATITRNGTYVANPAFPAAEANTAVLNCVTTVDVSAEICQLKLTFGDATVLTPGAGGDVTAGAGRSNLAAEWGADNNPPRVSGTLTGQHMYVHREGTTDPMITITKPTGVPNNEWNVRVEMIECNSPWKAPVLCTQYHKANSGVIRSYNQQCTTPVLPLAAAGNMELQSQFNRICIRKNAGRSQVMYNVNPQFEVGLDALAADATLESGVGTTTALNALGCQSVAGPVQGSVTFIGGNVHCGERLAPTGGQTANAPIIQEGAPFGLTHITTAVASNTRGFCIMYTQM